MSATEKRQVEQQIEVHRRVSDHMTNISLDLNVDTREMRKAWNHTMESIKRSVSVMRGVRYAELKKERERQATVKAFQEKREGKCHMGAEEFPIEMPNVVLKCSQCHVVGVYFVQNDIACTNWDCNWTRPRFRGKALAS